MTLVRLLARPMLSSMFIVGGLNAIKNADALADRAQPVIDGLQPIIAKAGSYLPVELDAKNVVRIDGLIHLVGGAMLATGKAPRLSSFVLAVSLVPTTLGGHRFWEETDPHKKANQKVHFFKNVSLVGGLLVASVDTAGKPSLAWRAKHQAARAKDRVVELTPG
jgi:putative oxidoreductase